MTISVSGITAGLVEVGGDQTRLGFFDGGGMGFMGWVGVGWGGIGTGRGKGEGDWKGEGRRGLDGEVWLGCSSVCGGIYDLVLFR